MLDVAIQAELIRVQNWECIKMLGIITVAYHGFLTHLESTAVSSCIENRCMLLCGLKFLCVLLKHTCYFYCALFQVCSYRVYFPGWGGQGKV